LGQGRLKGREQMDGVKPRPTCSDDKEQESKSMGKISSEVGDEMKCSICGVSDVYSGDSTGPLIGRQRSKTKENGQMQ
jgi:hypothetical protein